MNPFHAGLVVVLTGFVALQLGIGAWAILKCRRRGGPGKGGGG